MTKTDLGKCVLNSIKDLNKFTTEFIMQTCGCSASEINTFLLYNSDFNYDGGFDVNSQYQMWHRTKPLSTSFGPDYGEAEKPNMFSVEHAITLLKAHGYKILKQDWIEI
jgi:hypothetical protein